MRKPSERDHHALLLLCTSSRVDLSGYWLRTLNSNRFEVRAFAPLRASQPTVTWVGCWPEASTCFAKKQVCGNTSRKNLLYKNFESSPGSHILPFLKPRKFLDLPSCDKAFWKRSTQPKFGECRVRTLLVLNFNPYR